MRSKEKLIKSPNVKLIANNFVQFKSKQAKQNPYYQIKNDCSSAKANESSDAISSSHMSNTIFAINGQGLSPVSQREQSVNKLELLEQKVEFIEAQNILLRLRPKSNRDNSIISKQPINLENFESLNFHTNTTNINTSQNVTAINHKKKMKIDNNSSSDEISAEGLNESPSVKNLDGQNPKLLNYLKHPITLKSIGKFESCEITIDELDSRTRSIEIIYDQKGDEDDAGEIQQDDIEEKVEVQNNRDRSPQIKLHNQISQYSSISSVKNQFTPHNKAKALVIKNKTVMNYQDILKQKGSKCSCDTNAGNYFQNAQNSMAAIINLKKSQNSKIVINETLNLQTKYQDLEQFPQEKCGPYCKNLNGKEQKYIIKQLMKKQSAKYGNDDKNLKYVNQSNQGKVGERKYLISSMWWRQWCDFANFGEAMDQSMNTQDFDLKLKGDNSRDLLNDGRNNYLKESLIEHFDYEVVSQLIWNHLYSWYSADWCISRVIKADKYNNHKIYLDLYPGIIDFIQIKQRMHIRDQQKQQFLNQLPQFYLFCCTFKSFLFNPKLI
ncbi:ubiquitin carboxyl-terminal hydrolase [Stylonychia lemnae]|uniref:Ubiquitin carboxyl-terminal hydrolase n=1 Tax=Stylonychia lemnae TaxID=5949 RepID=A0A078AI60_STYLE|nr:ubiquitin carboxyl-terminal hydrolase [Stylonychia lemnae]|eukprot:CDW81945.1 ubiquitin carboxyl-terminal hydrolase [Stylonychia lemnae]